MTHRIIGAMAALMLLVSCHKPEPTQKTLSSASITYQKQELPKLLGIDAATLQLAISSQESWQIDLQQSAYWIALGQREGVGSGEVEITLLPNEQNQERQDSLFVTFGSGTRIGYQITQRAAAKGEMPTLLAHRMEIPRLREDDNSRFVAHFAQTTGRGVVLNYTMEYLLSQRQPRWAAFRFDKETSLITVKRQDSWSEDPKLVGYCALGSYGEWEGYKLDRGHIVASHDRVYSKSANDQTFYYSNIAPQVGKEFNQSIWQELEERVQSWGRDRNFCDTLYVVKGLSLDRPNGILGYVTSRENNARVPMAAKWYMALLKVYRGKYSAIAFVLPHRAYKAEEHFGSFVTTIDALESEMDVELFHLLDDSIEAEVESHVDDHEWKHLRP